MADTEDEGLQEKIERLVTLALEHHVPAEAIAAIVGDNMLLVLLANQKWNGSRPDARISPTFHSPEQEVVIASTGSSPEQKVVISRDQVARLVDMTPQSISWHVKHGNLEGVRVRVNGRSRLGIPLTSLCDYFEIAPERRSEALALLLADIGDGDPGTVFWDVPGESADPKLSGDVARILSWDMLPQMFI